MLFDFYHHKIPFVFSAMLHVWGNVSFRLPGRFLSFCFLSQTFAILESLQLKVVRTSEKENRWRNKKPNRFHLNKFLLPFSVVYCSLGCWKKKHKVLGKQFTPSFHFSFIEMCIMIVEAHRSLFMPSGRHQSISLTASYLYKDFHSSRSKEKQQLIQFIASWESWSCLSCTGTKTINSLWRDTKKKS